MVDHKLMDLLKSTMLVNPNEFQIPQNVLEKGQEHQLERLHAEYEYGVSSVVIIYDELQLTEVLSRVRLKMEDIWRCRDFSYKDTIGKKRDPSLPLKELFTEGLLHHLFEAEETDFNEPTLVLYHSFEGLVRNLKGHLTNKESSVDPPSSERCIWGDVSAYLDGACGRAWTESHGFLESPRLPKLLGSNEAPLIRTAAVMSMDEVAANNYYTILCGAQIRTYIPRDISVVYIF